MEPMSHSAENNTLCERCSLLSFDDLALGGRELVYEDGIPRLDFSYDRIEVRPKVNMPDDQDEWGYKLVRLDWEMEDILPDMPRLYRSSQLGCVFCQALLSSLEDAFAQEIKFYTTHSGTLHSVAYISLRDGGIEGLLVKTTFNPNRSCMGYRPTYDHPNRSPMDYSTTYYHPNRSSMDHSTMRQRSRRARINNDKNAGPHYPSDRGRSYKREIRILFPIEADSSESSYPAEF